MCSIAVAVLGTQVQKDKTIDDGYKERIDYAVNFLRESGKTGRYRHLYLILTGGETRKDLPSEAMAAWSFVRTQYPNLAEEGISLVLEGFSRTTPDNIMYVKRLLGKIPGIFFDTIVFVGRKPQMRKVPVIVWWQWGRLRFWRNNLPKFQYVGIDDPTTPHWERIIEPTLMVVLSAIDPLGKVTLWPLRKLMRNG